MTHTLDILPAIRCLYDASTDAAKWPDFVKQLANCLDARGAQIVRVQPRERTLTFSVLFGYDDVVRRMYGNDGAELETAFARYEKHFAELMPFDPRVRFIEQFPGRPLSCRQWITDAELHNSRAYQELLGPADVEYSLVVNSPEEDGSLIMFGVFRGKGSSFFNDSEVAAFGELIPHVKRAIAISERLARADFSNRAALEALDAIAMGVLLLDRDARILHVNVAGKRIIEAGDGISSPKGSLKLHAKDDDAVFRRAVWSAIAKVRAGAIPTAEAISVNRPSGKEPYPVMVGTLWGNHLRFKLGHLDRPLAVVFVTVPEEPQEAPADLLRRMFGLTPAEARLCERLVQGNTVDETAKDLDISVDTARVQLKSVFAKTGVNRQAELIAKVMSTPIWFRHRARDTPTLTS